MVLLRKACLRLSGAVILLTMLAGCVTNPSRDGFEPDGEAAGGTVIAPRRGTSAAVLDLLERARAASRRGELHKAEALLERAIRIEPKNPVLWHYMAKVHLHRGRARRAAGLAARSNSLAGDDATLRADNWRIIAHARQAMGDPAGARAAQARAAQLAGDR